MRVCVSSPAHLDLSRRMEEGYLTSIASTKGISGELERKFWISIAGQ